MTSRELDHSASPAGPLAPDLPADLPRLINSVILPGFIGTTVPQWLATALGNGLAGVVYFSHNIDPDAPEQVAALSAAIRATNPDAVIGVDEEGGNVTRLQSRDGSTIPGAAALGALDELAVTAAVGRAIGRLCRDAGINLTIAPVADVNTNPLNPVIGVRAFGSDTALVSAHTAAAVIGIQAERVAACAKHFPGHGDTVADSHMDTARVDLTMEQMRQFHLPPFKAAADAGVAAMMSAHIIIPELGEAPATLNPAAGALLREMGFEGVLITDALDMAAVRATVGPGEGGVLALLAGNDLLCVGNPQNAYTTGRDDESCYTEVYDALSAAATSGRLPVEVLRKAGARVQALAQWSKGNPLPETDDFYDWVAVSARACRLDSIGHGTAVSLPELTGSGLVTLVDARTGHNMAAGPTQNFLAQALGSYAVTEVNAAELSSAELEIVLMQSEGAVLVIVDSLDSPEQQETLELVLATAPGAVCINAGLVPEHACAVATIHCHGFSRVAAQAVVSLLEQEQDEL
ncbi:glycoside hydrolase family 3 N-terminal domain-containing protein [Arthrobacter sp. E3]|uniref:glycoside hydrolase family 3 protein n=1 Tax=Arthrobacter sp. E3 TaxID=517402 RepID=UPI001A94B6BB|nr:glycoside hydrolase family 3 N-terminal domain-containing protein [Arthrobacter sp. E3]